MRIIIVAVGKLKAPFVDDVEHYRKLLGRYARLELIEVADDTQVQKRIPERAFVSLLTETGQSLDSQQFSRFLEDRRGSSVDLCFVIQGPFGGLKLDRVDHELSLGAQTMPHQLARVVLLEQLYRGHKIIAGETYHY